MSRTLKRVLFVSGMALSILTMGSVSQVHGKSITPVNSSMMNEAETTVNTVPAKITRSVNAISNKHAIAKNNNQSTQQQSTAYQHGLKAGRDYTIVPTRYRHNDPYAKAYVTQNKPQTDVKQIKSYQGYRENKGRVGFNKITNDPNLANTYRYGIHASNHENSFALDQNQSNTYERGLFGRSHLSSDYWKPYQTTILYNNGDQKGKFASKLYRQFPNHHVIYFSRSTTDGQKTHGYRGYVNGIIFTKKHNRVTKRVIKHFKKYIWSLYHGSVRKRKRVSRRFRKHYVIKNVSNNSESSYPSHFLIYQKNHEHTSSIIYIMPFGSLGFIPRT